MQNLEKLYESAEKYLAQKNQDWRGFANNFRKIFNSEMALYCAKPGNENLEVFSFDDFFITTDEKAIKNYFEQGMFKYNHILASPQNPFEPIRRTDAISDDEYIKLELTQKYLLPNGLFYLMIVYSKLPDGSDFVLFVWRSEGQEDFSDIEKQRLALFMRYLANLIKTMGSISLQNPDKEIKQFGEKYNLTDTEIEILSALLQGHSLKMIAKETNRKYGTIRWHVQNILQKCQVKNQKKLLSDFYALIKR